MTERRYGRPPGSVAQSLMSREDMDQMRRQYLAYCERNGAQPGGWGALQSWVAGRWEGPGDVPSEATWRRRFRGQQVVGWCARRLHAIAATIAWLGMVCACHQHVRLLHLLLEGVAHSHHSHF